MREEMALKVPANPVDCSRNEQLAGIVPFVAGWRVKTGIFRGSLQWQLLW